MNQLKQFVAAPWRGDGLWGGGHTVDTDPTKQGWRVFKGGAPDCIVVGRRGVDGCFSAVRLSNNRLDVALYDWKPEQVLEHWESKAEGGIPCHYVVIDDIPGWGLSALEELKKYMRD